MVCWKSSSVSPGKPQMMSVAMVTPGTLKERQRESFRLFIKCVLSSWHRLNKTQKEKNPVFKFWKEVGLFFLACITTGKSALSTTIKQNWKRVHNFELSVLISHGIICSYSWVINFTKPWKEENVRNQDIRGLSQRTNSASLTLIIAPWWQSIVIDYWPAGLLD